MSYTVQPTAGTRRCPRCRNKKYNKIAKEQPEYENLKDDVPPNLMQCHQCGYMWLHKYFGVT